MNLIAEIWDGKLPLVKVYWLYGVAVGAFFTIFSLLIKDYPIALIVIAIALIPYQILVFVGIWRSADAYRDKKIWAILAKVHVVFGVIAALNGVASLTKTSSSDGSHILSNCVKCEDGKCEPHTAWRNAVVKLSPNDNTMLITNELWEKDENGKFINDITFNSIEKNSSTSLFPFPTCAIKTNDEGFCEVGLNRFQYENDIILTESSFNYKNGKFVLTHNRQFIDANTKLQTSTSITTHECS
jgi:hypothetical protein